MSNNDPGPLGQPFEDFLVEQGLRDEVYCMAVKRVLAWRATRDGATRDNGDLLRDDDEPR